MKGFTLIEILMSIVIVAVMSMIINQILIQQQRSSLFQRDKRALKEHIANQAELILSAPNMIYHDTDWDKIIDESDTCYFRLIALDSLKIEDMALNSDWDETEFKEMKTRPQEVLLQLFYEPEREKLIDQVLLMVGAYNWYHE